MFIKTFKNNYFLQLTILSIIPIILWMPAFISPPQPVSTAYDTPVYGLIFDTFSNLKTLSTILAFILVLIQGLLINNIFSSNHLSPTTTFFPAFIYVILLSSNYSLMTISPLLILNTFNILAIYCIFRSFDRPEGLDEIFCSSLFISLSFLTYKPSILLILWIWLSLLNYRFYKWRYWTISLLGFLTPIIFVGTYYYIADRLVMESQALINGINFIPNFHVDVQPINIVFYIIIGILGIISLIYLLSSKAENNINYRKKTNVIIIFTLTALLPGLYGIGQDYLIYLLAPVLAYILFHFFTTKRKLIYSNIIFSILFVLIITKLIFSLT